MYRPLLSVSALALLLGGCAVGPNYRAPPAVVMAPAWVEPADTAAVDTAWWERLGDPALTALIAAADTHSPDLRAAAARFAEARANRDAAAGGRLPQLSASGSATSNRLSENGQIPVGRIPGFSRNYDLIDGGFDASWEIDLWGRASRNVEGAAARTAAAQAEQRGMRVSLHAEIARTYVDLRAAQAKLASVGDDADAQGRIATLVEQRFKAGEASRFDWLRAQSQAQATAAQIPGLEADIRSAAYSLALLVGQPPEAVAPDLLNPAPIPTAPEAIALGLRSDLLLRRPDVAQAERQLAAATADIGVATADLFPRFSLIGGIGQQARSVGDLSDGASTRFQIGPSFSWPIFSGGTIRARIRAADARADQAAAQYEKAVLTALSESETAVNRFARAARTQAQSRAARDAQQQVLALATQRFRAGEDDLLTLLDAQSSYAQVERNAIDADAARTTQAIILYKALGGGAP